MYRRKRPLVVDITVRGVSNRQRGGGRSRWTTVTSPLTPSGTASEPPADLSSLFSNRSGSSSFFEHLDNIIEFRMTALLRPNPIGARSACGPVHVRALASRLQCSRARVYLPCLGYAPTSSLQAMTRDRVVAGISVEAFETIVQHGNAEWTPWDQRR
jgi:hypothetical protein